jgi:branched-subunit amino acid transport protein
MTATFALVGAAAGSYLLRIAFVNLIDVDRLPAAIRESLAYVGPAVTAAIVVSALAGSAGRAGLALSAAQVAGLAAAALIAWRTKSLLWALGAAMATFAVVGLVS